MRKALRERGRAYVLDVGEQLRVCFGKPEPFLPKSSGKGRPPKRLTIAEEQSALKELIERIEQGAWRTMTYREGTKSPLIRQAVIRKMWIWKKETHTIKEAELLISRKIDGTEVKYSLCYEPAGELKIEKALYRQMQRYWIERAFQEIKEQIGLKQYQVRGWKAWHHHIALTMMALHFILETQIENAENLPLMSCGDVKLMMATIHQRQQVRRDDILRHRLLLI